MTGRCSARHKANFWAEQGLTAAARLGMAAELYKYVRALRPDWPDAAEREADFAAHVLLAEKLRAIQICPR